MQRPSSHRVRFFPLKHRLPHVEDRTERQLFLFSSDLLGMGRSPWVDWASAEGRIDRELMGARSWFRNGPLIQKPYIEIQDPTTIPYEPAPVGSVNLRVALRTPLRWRAPHRRAAVEVTLDSPGRRGSKPCKRAAVLVTGVHAAGGSPSSRLHGSREKERRLVVEKPWGCETNPMNPCVLII